MAKPAFNPVYPIVYFDALQVKIRTDFTVAGPAVYLALAVNMDGEKELLGLWIAQAEGAKFWLGVLNELKNRGVEDLFIACIDGLSGFPEAVEAAFPQPRSNCASSTWSAIAYAMYPGNSARPSPPA